MFELRKRINCEIFEEKLYLIVQESLYESEITLVKKREKKKKIESSGDFGKIERSKKLNNNNKQQQQQRS